MLRKKFNAISIALGIISLSSCLEDQNAEIGIKGHFQDEAGNPSSDVSVFYGKSLVTFKTDSTGQFMSYKPRTLFIEFKKEGYRTLSTKIRNFSDDAAYDFGNIILKKTGSSPSDYKDISLSTDPNSKSFKFSGMVLNSYTEPLKDVTITLNDSLKISYNPINEGNFYFKVLDNQISINKEGFQKTVLNLPVFEKGPRKITLIETTSKKGIYLIKDRKYVPLPQTKLLLKSEEKIGSILWGGSFSYNITDFFYPEKAKEFKTENDSFLRFIIFEPDLSSTPFEAQNTDGYLCTANYKWSTSPSPDSKTLRLNIKEVYPVKYSLKPFNSPKIIEFKPPNKNRKFAFVNTENKTGYCFTY